MIIFFLPKLWTLEQKLTNQYQVKGAHSNTTQNYSCKTIFHYPTCNYSSNEYFFTTLLGFEKGLMRSPFEDSSHLLRTTQFTCSENYWHPLSWLLTCSEDSFWVIFTKSVCFLGTCFLRTSLFLLNSCLFNHHWELMNYKILTIDGYL